MAGKGQWGGKGAEWHMGELPQASGVAEQVIGSAWAKGSPETRRAQGRALPYYPGSWMNGKRKRGECFHSPRLVFGLFNRRIPCARQGLSMGLGIEEGGGQAGDEILRLR